MAVINIDLNWQNYFLAQPGWLWLIPVFIFTVLLIPKIKNKYMVISESAGLANISHNKPSLFHPLIALLNTNKKSTTHPPTHAVFYSVIFTLLVIALSQPVRTGKKLPDPPQERDIVFIVDTSVSMILRDYILNGERIDRMSLLKGVLSKFISKLKGERMSIIVFGDNAYTLVPLTSDHYLLQKMLSRVQATMAGRFNAIGEAIALAVKQATDFNTQNNKTKRKRVLVLLTDADQPTGKIDPDVAANLASKAELPLYTIAIGATSLAAEEKRQSGLLYSPVDLNLINRLSGITGAKSYQAGNPDALENAIQEINLHETNKHEVKPLYYREALYFWFLIAALIIFSLGQLMFIFKTTITKSGTDFRP